MLSNHLTKNLLYIFVFAAPFNTARAEDEPIAGPKKTITPEAKERSQREELKAPLDSKAVLKSETQKPAEVPNQLRPPPAKVIAIVKKSGWIIINAGKNQGYNKGDNVCFYDAEKEILCSKIYKIKAKMSGTKLKDRGKLELIRKGMKVKKIGATELETDQKHIITLKEPAAPLNFRVFWLPSLMEIASYKKIFYSNKGSSGSSFWETEDAKEIMLGFGAEFGFGIGGIPGHIGLRYKKAEEDEVQSNYDDIDTDGNGLADRFVTTAQKMSSLGIFFDVYYYQTMLGPIMMMIGNGLDYYISTIDFKATVENELDATESNTYYKANSKLNILSLRAALGFDYPLVNEAFKLSFGLYLYLPLVAAKKDSATNSAPNNNTIAPKDPHKDILEALDHKKSSTGLDLYLGCRWDF